MPKYRTDLVTRRLCAATHLDQILARAVWEEYVEDGLQAVALPQGINLVALVRHTGQALARWRRRDRGLAVAALLLPMATALALWQVVVGAQDAASIAAGVAAVTLVAAWGVAYEAELSARRAALRLGREGAPVTDLARAVDPAVEQRLESMKRANFVAYHSEVERINPFVGSGWRITEAVWDAVDVSRPAKDDQGREEKIIPFDAADLHHYLAVEMPKIVGLETLQARNRLYVRGLHVAYLGADVLPDATRPPAVVVPKQLVKTGAVQAGAGAETYLCLRMLGPGGRVVVTMHLRAHLLMPRLTWEVTAYVIPPLSERFDAVEYVPTGPARLRWHTVRTVNRGFRHTLFGAPGRLNGESTRLRRKARRLNQVRKEIRKGRTDWDYGAENGLREAVADWERMGYIERRDTSHYFKRLEQGVLLATGAFLREHRVDTSDFEDTEKRIVNAQTYNFAGPITGPAQFGSHLQQVNQQQPTPPPSGGNQPGPPGRS
ncbi:hypothetical protein [Streptomyces sp. NPDC050704]|uniref:hypothetical protein n=1 Tax=Streptomyces sp. NPDC050704 TaxID=3157219 RepID=UPI003422CF10